MEIKFAFLFIRPFITANNTEDHKLGFFIKNSIDNAPITQPYQMKPVIKFFDAKRSRVRTKI